MPALGLHPRADVVGTSPKPQEEYSPENVVISEVAVIRGIMYVLPRGKMSFLIIPSQLTLVVSGERLFSSCVTGSLPCALFMSPM